MNMDGMNNNTINYNLFGGRRSAEAIRSTGYKTTGNALGEIVDNSIQAGATEVKIIVEVAKFRKHQRVTQNIVKIGVLDNGCGMTSDVLRKALLFGEGSHFGEKGGLGKFGVGLPQASLSQGTVLKVWTWQDGPDSAIYTGYDIYDEEWRAKGSQIPAPVSDLIPKPWSRYIDKASSSGTLVLWSNLDRLSCTKANTLFEKSEMLIGRMYRRWINDNFVSIEYITIDSDTGDQLESRYFRAVDPLFLMSNTVISGLEGDDAPPVDPMFNALEPFEMNITYGDVTSKVIIRTSYVKDEIAKLVNKKDAAGRTTYGKIAGANIGLSIVREGRELELDPNWTMNTSNNRDPRHRWWGAEIEFGRDLDDVFGVTNDKQSATALSDAWNVRYEDFRLGSESISDIKERMMEDEPRLCINIDVAQTIRDLIKNAESKIPKTNFAYEDKKDPITTEVEGKATERINLQKERGQVGISDAGENAPIEERKQELITAMDNMGASKAEIDEVVKNFITYGYKFYFVKQKMPGEDAFFTIRADAGLLLIVLNESHPLYDELFASFEYVDSGKDFEKEELSEMLRSSYSAIKYILASWARLEDIALKEGKRGPSRYRPEWGRQAAFLKNDDNLDDDD